MGPQTNIFLKITWLTLLNTHLQSSAKYYNTHTPLSVTIFGTRKLSTFNKEKHQTQTILSL